MGDDLRQCPNIKELKAICRDICFHGIQGRNGGVRGVTAGGY